MTKGKPVSLILKFMIPLIVGNVFQQLYNMVDTIVVGRFVGVQALAAVGATGTIMFLIFGFMQGLTTGFTVLTAQCFGAGDEKGLKKSVGNAVVLSAVMTVIMTIISVMGVDWLLTVMRTPEDIYEMSREYILIICMGMAFNIFYNLTASFLRAVGNSKVPVYSLMAGACCNIVLDLLLVIVIPMGVMGVAVATVVSQGIGGLLCLIYIIRRVPLMHVKKEDLVIDYAWASRQIKIGIPMALQFSITAVGAILVQVALNLLGSTAVASYTAACKVEMLVNQFYGAMGMTIATYSAQNKGVNNIPRIRKGIRDANVMSAVYSLAVYGIVVMLLTPMIHLFVGEGAEVVLPYAKTYIYICGACYIPLGMIFIFRNAMQGCGFGILPMLGGVVELFSRTAAAYVAVRFASFAGVCIANGGTWVITGIFLAVSYLFTVGRLPVSAKETLE